jgi:hypothetical protein
MAVFAMFLDGSSCVGLLLYDFHHESRASASLLRPDSLTLANGTSDVPLLLAELVLQADRLKPVDPVAEQSDQTRCHDSSGFAEAGSSSEATGAIAE